MKRVKQLVLLGLLVSAGAFGQNPNFQKLSSVRIGTTQDGAKFLVDGQTYTSLQNFVWPEGTRHCIQFPTTSETDGTPSPFQYWDDRVARYTFGGWSVTTTIPNFVFTGCFIASPETTEFVAGVAIEFPIYVTFPEVTPDDGCTATPAQDIDRKGVLFIDDFCFSNTTIHWTSAGVHNILGWSYPGWAFTGITVGNLPFLTKYAFPLKLESKVQIGPLFEKAKRMHITSNPLGLQVLVDRSLVTTPPYYKWYLEPINYDPNCSPDYSRIGPNSPLSVPLLCVGDFDFLPGSTHQLGAPEYQTDRDARFWVFDHFSNGLGQNSTYITPGDPLQVDNIEAFFVPGVQSAINTNINGLQVEVDGRTNWPGPTYGFIWGEGHTHTIKAPLTQTDSKGRVYRFTGWSDGGDVQHTVTIPVGAQAFTVTANFELLGQVKVTSTPSGLTVLVNGADCITPCSYDQAVGSTLSISAEKTISLGETSRYEFVSWTGGPNTLAQQATFTANVQTLNVEYHGAHLITTASDPDNGAKFRFSPEFPDGFYPEGIDLQVSVVPNTGFKFLGWGGEVTGTSSPARFKVTGPTSLIAYMEKVPGIAPAGIRNAAGDTPDDTVSPGSIISVYGEQLAETLEIGPYNPLAQAIGRTYLTVGDSLLPLIFVSPEQINAQLPSGLSDGEYTLTVHQIGKPDSSGKFKVRRNSPGVYYNVTEDGMSLVAALHEDGSAITQQSPARRGETVSFFGTGFGPYDRPVIDGFILPDTQVYRLTDSVKVLAGLPTPQVPAGAAAAEATLPPPVVRDPVFAGGAAGMVGTSMVKVKIDPDLPTGNVLELFVTVNGTQSNRVQLPVR
ncbi:MAG: hypothetical protein ABI811_20720 [Acidobacteriota bacterium]